MSNKKAPMSNWFENNQTKSILIYTLTIVAATWATSRFVFQDNRIELLKSEIDAQKAQSDQYRSKAELLSKDLETVRAENAEYRAWLSQSKNAVPAIMPRISALKGYISALEGQVEKLSNNKPASIQLVRDARRGEPVIDERTGLQIEVKDVTIDKQASIIVKFPDRDTKSHFSVKGGEQLKFKVGPLVYVLSIGRVYFIADGIEFSVFQRSEQ